MKTSALLASLSSTLRADSCLRSSTIERLLRFTARKNAPMSGLRMGPSCRVVSPSGGSTLMTSAPRSPSCWAAHGPSTTVVQSMTRTPWSGPDTSEPRLRAAGDDERLAADEVAVRAAEEVDRARRLLGEPATAERDHLVHGRDARALHAHLHLAAGHLYRAGLPLGARLGQAR